LTAPLGSELASAGAAAETGRATADAAEVAREPAAWSVPLGVAAAGVVAEAGWVTAGAAAAGAVAETGWVTADAAAAGAVTETGWVTADADEVAVDPAAWSAPLGVEVAAGGAFEADDVEAGAGATLTGLGAGAVASWVSVEPALTVEPTVWATLDGAAATDDSGEEPVAVEPDVAGATGAERSVAVELADGVAVGELAERAGAAADATELAGVDLAGALWDELDEARADCDAAGRAAGVEVEAGAELSAELA
jgi:hypothetical protein